MNIIGRYGTVYNYINLISDSLLDCKSYRDFHDQFSDSTIYMILQNVKHRSHYVYCEEQPIFKNGGIEFNIVKSQFYNECMDFVVEVMPELAGDHWDYDMILEEWVASFLSLQVPDSEDFLPTTKSRSEISDMFLGLCKSLVEIGGEDYESLIHEAVESFSEYF